jgi:hypothetical protein
MKTARDERVVTVAPGAITDRRKNLEGRDGVPKGELPVGDIGKPRELGRDVEDRPLQNEATTSDGNPSVDPISTRSPYPNDALGLRVTGRGLRSPKRSLETQPLIHDPFLMLRELERHRRSLDILLLLYSEQSASKSRIRRQLQSGQESVNGSLRCLLRFGLVRLDENFTFPFSRSFRLTEKGKSIVETPLRSWSLILLQ